MVSLLLAITYLAFISLGLPDSLLGSAWPVMRLELGAPISYAGIISMIIAIGTIISSLLSSRMIRKFGPGLVTAVSVAMTAAALFGFSVSNAFPLLCLWAVPYGLGAGGMGVQLPWRGAVRRRRYRHSLSARYIYRGRDQTVRLSIPSRAERRHKRIQNLRQAG